MTPCPAIIERTHYGQLPKAPPTQRERISTWRWKWAQLTVEQTLGPIYTPVPRHRALVPVN